MKFVVEVYHKPRPEYLRLIGLFCCAQCIRSHFVSLQLNNNVVSLVCRVKSRRNMLSNVYDLTQNTNNMYKITPVTNTVVQSDMNYHVKRKN
jgi:hypothetical protein